jgi:hypothetical protein
MTKATLQTTFEGKTIHQMNSDRPYTHAVVALASWKEGAAPSVFAHSMTLQGAEKSAQVAKSRGFEVLGIVEVTRT